MLTFTHKFSLLSLHLLEWLLLVYRWKCIESKFDLGLVGLEVALHLLTGPFWKFLGVFFTTLEAYLVKDNLKLKIFICRITLISCTNFGKTIKAMCVENWRLIECFIVYWWFKVLDYKVEFFNISLAITFDRPQES